MSGSDRPLAPGEVARLLPATVAVLRAELTALPDRLLAWHPAPGEWCVQEVLGHLIEAERRGFAGRIRIILDADAPMLERWEPADVARARGDCAKSAANLASSCPSNSRRATRRGA